MVSEDEAKRILAERFRYIKHQAYDVNSVEEFFDVYYSDRGVPSSKEYIREAAIASRKQEIEELGFCFHDPYGSITGRNILFSPYKLI